MTDGIIRFFFEFCENLHIQPDWWEGLSDKKRDALVGRLNESGKPWVERESGCLVEDNVRFDNWTISNAKDILH
jgi:hypothetical protein